MAKYAHPKILLIDCMSDVETRLKDVGFDVATGTFGGSLPWGDQEDLARVNGQLPFDFAERRVVIVDMDPEAIAGQQKGEEWQPASGNTAFVYYRDYAAEADTRPLFMTIRRDEFDTILGCGGIFVCFVAARTEIRGGVIKDRRRTEDHTLRSWDFLSALNVGVLDVEAAQGNEISLVKDAEKSPVGRVVTDHLEGARYFCVFQINPKLGWRFEWRPILKNPNAQVTGAILQPKPEQTQSTEREGAGTRPVSGLVFLLPQLSGKPDFLVRLLTEELPGYLPELFPDFAGETWVCQPEYEHGPVIERRERIRLIEQEVAGTVKEINAEIAHIRDACKFLSDLLTEQDDALVDAVEEALCRLGFRDIVNIDDEIAAGREGGRRREDLRICDREPELLVEVKGVAGTGADEHSLAAHKYVAPRMKERGDTNVRALSIVNLQRHRAPLDRASDPFRELVLENARKNEFGIMTTWDLFRLTRSFMEYGWRHDDVSDLFYQSGRIDPVPKHYVFVGVIGQVLERDGTVILKVELKEGEIRRGDIIAVELRHKFVEQKASSMRVRKDDVAVAVAGTQVGIASALSRSLFANRLRVFRVGPSA